MRFDRGYISPYFITNAKTQKAELENPYILIVDKKISGAQLMSLRVPSMQPRQSATNKRTRRIACCGAACLGCTLVSCAANRGMNCTAHEAVPFSSSLRARPPPGLATILPVLEAVLKVQRPLLIIAEDVEVCVCTVSSSLPPR